MNTQRRRRSITVVATGTAVFATAALFVHHDTGARRDYQGVCLDERTQTRTDDRNCGNPGYHHVFFPAGARFPAVGQPMGAGFRETLPSGHAARLSGASTVGGEVARGGFGTTSRGWHGWSVGG